MCRMRSCIRKLLVTLAGTALCVASAAAEPPEASGAPEGFQWYVFEEGDSACLYPRDWFVKTEVQGDTAALFFSKESIDKEGRFRTGLTLNVARRIQAKSGTTPSQYAKTYLEALLARHADAKRFENPPQDGMPGIGAAYVDKEPLPPVVIYTFLLADDENDVLRIFILESPQAEWTETWALGEHMLDCKIRR